MKNKKCGIAQLVELAMGPRAVTVVTGRPGVGRTTLLAAMARYAAKNGEPVIYATNGETREDARRRFEGMGAEAAARLHVNNYQNEAICDVDATVTVLDARGVTPENFDAIRGMVMATNASRATIVGVPETNEQWRTGFRPEYEADVLIELSRDKSRIAVPDAS